MAFCIEDNLLNECDEPNPMGGLYGKLYLADASAIDGAFTLGVDGQIDSISMVTTPDPGYFHEFDIIENLNSLTESGSQNDARAFINHSELVFVVAGRSQTARNVLQKLAKCKCGIVSIHTEGGGKRWVSGYTADQVQGVGLAARYATVTALEAATGAAAEDSNQYTVTISWKSNEMCRELDPAFDITTLLEP